jgi:hypothetical protein
MEKGRTCQTLLVEDIEHRPEGRLVFVRSGLKAALYHNLLISSSAH